mmetsp:Transcript_52501/g.94150  ORF Transcript_52501/g.94150 Transcript_52501/m.94150 type:complete len:86 (+) Transcript_52501:489-746(+)
MENAAKQNTSKYDGEDRKRVLLFLVRSPLFAQYLMQEPCNQEEGRHIHHLEHIVTRGIDREISVQPSRGRESESKSPSIESQSAG